jgi:hypothetical protein
MTRQEAAKLVAVILAACPAQGSKLNEQRQLAMVDAFESLLGDIPYAAASAAVAVLLQTKPYMPAIAEIRSTVLELSGNSIAPGGEQWGAVLEAVRRYGSYRTPGVDFHFNDDTTGRCVKALGWQEICLSENQTADRARFIELYDKLAAHSHREKQAPLLGAAKQARELRDADAHGVVLQLSERLTRKP